MTRQPESERAPQSGKEERAVDDELPGMLAVAKGITEQRWPHTMDAKVWADEFVKLNSAADHGTMLSWFASAIMAGYDTARSRAPQLYAAPQVPQGNVGPADSTEENRPQPAATAPHPTRGPGSETDAARVYFPDKVGPPDASSNEDFGYFVSAQLFRSLERRLCAAREELDKRDSALAGLADCINTELRENYGWHEQIPNASTDMRPFVRLLVDKVRAAITQRALKAEAELAAVRKRLNWAANELLSCDYGDNPEQRGLGWNVFGWRDVKGIHSIVPYDKVRRIYGKTIDQAIDSEIDDAAKREGG